MRLHRVATLVLCAVASSSPALADTLSGTRSELVSERSHVIQLRLEPGHAEMTVRRTIENKGARHDQAIYFLELPSGGVATGLRTLGYVDGEHRWFNADLLEREEAAKRYRELTGVGMAIPKDPALLYWVGVGRLGLQVFPVAPSSLKTVEYTVKIPTEYIDGRDVVRIPASVAVADSVPEIIVTSKDPQDRIFTDFTATLRFCSHCANEAIEYPLAQGARVSLGGGDVHFALEHVTAPRLGGRLAVIPVRPDKIMSHVRVELPRRVSQVPRGARIAIVLDASKSMSNLFDAELTAARAYLSHFVDAEVEIISFDRTPHAKYGKLTPAASVHADLRAMRLTAANGSNLDDALARADVLLQATPAGTPRRVVLFTDLRTRSTLTPDSTKGKLAASGALLHVVDIGTGAASLTRDDEGDWAKVPRATGGLLWNGLASPSNTAHSREVFEELARPKRVDRLRFVANGWPADALDSAPDTLAEGQSWEDERVAFSTLRSLDLAGELWSTPIKQSIAADPTEARHWAALFFGGSLYSELGDDEMMTLAKLGGAVSPVTSYLAIEPGVRPSTEGLEEGVGNLGFGTGGGGLGAGIGLGSIGTIGRADAEAWFRAALADDWSRCGGKGRSITLTFETTSDEIVEVRASLADPLGKCMTEAAWALDLPASQFRSSFATYSVSL